MPLVDIYAERKRQEVYRATWGHLIAAPGVYAGYIVFARCAYDGLSPIIMSGFEGVDDSPWFYEHMSDLVDEHTEGATEGGVWIWRGTYRRFTNGNHRFSGKASALFLPPP